MTNLDQKVRELRALAEKATPGPWRSAGGYLTVRNPDGNSFGFSIYHLDEMGQQSFSAPFQAVPFSKPENAAYIAAANPAALTAILDEYDRRGAALVEAEGARTKYKRGDVIRRDGQWLRFIEEELEGEKWEIIGPVAAPPAAGREEIARIVSPEAFEPLPHGNIVRGREAVALAKADAILSALGRTEAPTPPEGEGLTPGD